MKILMPMCKIYTTLIAFMLLLGTAYAQPCSDLFISEYVEGSGDNKYIEIYNPTGSDVDLSDYELRFYANGNTMPNSTNTLSGTLASDDVIIYSNSGAIAYEGPTTTASAVNFNGDDAMALYNTSTGQFADIFGRIGEDPGTQWNVGGNMTQNRTLRRNSDVTQGVSTNPSDNFPTLGTEWTEFPQDNISGLGEHSFDGCPPPPPAEAGDIIITEIMKNPNTISDSDGEWFEVYNTTDADIDLIGWEISDDDGESHVIESSVVVPAGGYAALARNGDPGANGGIVFDYEYGDDITMGNNSDEVILTTPDETEIDRVEYDNGDEFPDPNGESLNLSLDAFDATANDNGFNWCPATSPYAMNNDGTPGAANEVCPCIITDIEMLNISPCNEDDNSFTADVKVSFLRAPAMGSLQLRRDAREGETINNLDGPTMHTFTNVLFPVADGRDLEIRARFRMDGENLCSLTDDELGPAPQSCLGNDLCEDAVEIGCDETILSTTRGYSNDDNPGGCFTNLSTARGVWFVFTGTGEFIEVTTCGEETDFDTKLGVFEGPCGDLECIDGDDDEDCPFAELTSRVFIQSEVGVDYYIYVTGFGNSRGTFELSVFCIPPPENDDACDATPLMVGVPGVVNNFGATVQDGEPSPGAGTDGSFGSCVSTDGWCEFETEVDNSVWYTIDIAEEGCYEIFTYYRDLQLAVWSVDDCSDFSTFTEVYANDDFGPFGPDGPPFPFPPFPGDGEPGLGGYDIAQRGIDDGPIGPGPGPGSAAPYLNVYLEAGTYYIQVDGFEGEFAFEDVILVQPSEDCIFPCEEKNLTLTLTLDAFPQETTWELRDKDGNLFGQGGPYFPFDGPAPGDEGEEPPTFVVIENLCSEAECYDFSIFDSFGDGICCDIGEGSYVFTIDDEIIYEGDGMYGAGETVEICIDPCILAGYDTDDVGSAPTEGEYNCEDDMVVVTTTGQNGFDLGKDNFGYVYQELCGDGEIIAKVESVDNNGWAGIMFRETIDSDAKQAAIYSQLSPITQTQTRYLTGTLKIIQQHFNGPFAMWLKIERQGDWFFSYKSPDGINFSYVHAVNVSMDPCITVGMGAYTSEIGVPVTATFSNIEINGGIVPIATPEANITFSTQNDGKTKLFPNPANNFVTIDFGTTIDRPTTMILRNQLGQVVEQRRLEVPAIRTEWNVNSFVDGLYYIEIRTEGEDAEVLRFIKN